MNCQLIQDKMKSFLDDLLEESEYQEIRFHLEECQACAAYASSVGSLSYKVKELGQLPLPQDLAQTILFEAKRPKEASATVFTQNIITGKTREMPVFIFRWATLFLVLMIFLVSVFLFAGIASRKPTMNVLEHHPVLAPKAEEKNLIPTVQASYETGNLALDIQAIVDTAAFNATNQEILDQLQPLLSRTYEDAGSLLLLDGVDRLIKLARLDPDHVSLLQELKGILLQYQESHALNQKKVEGL